MDTLGDRMKLFERAEAGRKLMPLLPAMARIDGRSFSNFTRDLNRPFDPRLCTLMVETTRYLVEHTGAICGYTQSDEISLCWLQPHYESEIFFAGKIQKMVSQLAAQATVKFNASLEAAGFPKEYAERLPTFDARVWNVPNRVEAVNTFVWRELDASKNSMSMLAQSHYSHAQLQNKGWSDMHEMLHAKGVNWNNYPSFFKRGTFIRRRKTERAFTAAEIAKLPPQHEAHRDPDLVVVRTELLADEIPPLRRIANREKVLFAGADPVALLD